MRPAPQWTVELLARTTPTDHVVKLMLSEPKDAAKQLFRLHLLDAYAHARFANPRTLADPLIRFMVRLSDEDDVASEDGGDYLWEGLFRSLKEDDLDEFIEQCNVTFRHAFKWDYVPVYAWLYEGQNGEPVSRFPDLKQQMEELPSKIEAALKASAPVQASEKSGGCYIATAVYGSYEAPQVLVLRRFRDERLASSALGRLAIETYYKISPPLARNLPRLVWLSHQVRRALDAVVARLEPLPRDPKGRS